jgi:hypothetical protein
MMNAYSATSDVRAAVRPSGQRRPGPLARYLIAAVLARGADGAAAVGLVALATSRDAHLARGAQAGGLLVAALMAPHLLAPCLARRLDRARDGRVVLASAFAGYGIALATGALLVGRAPLAAAAAAIAIAGTCGPLLTGGLSSRLAGVTRGHGRSLRRAEGWDAATYGLAGSAGPAAVAAVAAIASPLGAMMMLAVAALAAAMATLTLPPAERSSTSRPDAPGVRSTLRFMASHGPLRRVSLASMLTAVSGGALSVVAVILGSKLGAGAAGGATLVAAFGLGNLVGSLLVTAFPQRGEPERLVTRHLAIMGAALCLCAVAPSYPLALGAFALAGASNAPFFTATLAARSSYAPPAARAQVFVSLAGAKVALASGGAAFAGAAMALGPRAILAAGAALTLAAAAAAVLDRRLTG